MSRILNFFNAIFGNPNPRKQISDYVNAIYGNTSIQNEAMGDIRQSICNNCPFRSTLNYCTHTECGCNLSHKKLMPDQKCPIGKW